VTVPLPASAADVPATDLLCLRDAYLRRFEATVVAVDPAAGWVVLDQTAFYPGGGGQPADEGFLEVQGTVGEPAGRWRVTGFAKEGRQVRHLLEAEGIGAGWPAVGDRLAGELDWERRYRLMRTHTALHVLCGVVFKLYGALVTGGNMGPDKARMDFELEDLNPARVAEIEARANAEIAAARDVRIQALPRAEAFAIPDLIRTKINLLPEGITEVRTVEVVGLDLQADGGTHVANTREVGGIAVVGTRSKGRINKRLEIVLVD
jgi:misacylated tRNA(Ala) deacylase